LSQYNRTEHQAESAENHEHGAKIGMEAANVVNHDERFLFEAANTAI
jgi:hypothetical protein